MKHIAKISAPAKAAILPEGHPTILDSIWALAKDPQGVIGQHLNKQV